MELMKRSRKELGEKGERLAEKFLKKKGYKILEKNYRNRYGEIDIIASDKGCLVFVEVKTSSVSEFDAPETWVNIRKQSQIGKMAQLYLNDKDITDTDCRFDVIGIRMPDDQKENIEHIEGAFSL